MEKPLSDPSQTRGSRGRTAAIDKHELVRRIEAGESGSEVARAFGVSRQYVSIVWKDYQQRGEAALHTKRKTGRPPIRKLNDAEAAELLDLIRTNTPEGLNLSVFLYGNRWTIETVRELAEKRFGFLPSRRHVAERLESWGMPTREPHPIEVAMYTPEFKAYLKSPLCKQIEEREKANFERMNREAEARLRLRDQTFLEDDQPDPSTGGSAAEPPLKPVDGVARKRVPSHSLRTGKHAKGGRATKGKRKRSEKK